MKFNYEEFEEISKYLDVELCERIDDWLLQIQSTDNKSITYSLLSNTFNVSISESMNIINRIVETGLLVEKYQIFCEECGNNSHCISKSDAYHYIGNLFICKSCKTSFVLSRNQLTKIYKLNEDRLN